MTTGPIAAPTRAAASPAVDAQRASQIREAARRFEALLAQQLVQVMRATTSGLFEGTAGSLYGSMFDEAMGDALARGGGLGLADVIARSLGVAAEPATSRPAATAAPVASAFGPVLEDRPPAGVALPGATGDLQRVAAEMIPEDGIAPQWGRDGTLTTADLASDFHTEEPGGAAYFRVRDVRGYQGYYKCNLFALELARRAGFEVPLAGARHGWGYVGPTFLARDAEDGRLHGDWARVVNGASAAELDTAIVRGESAFLVTGAGADGRRGHMGIVERVHEVEYDAQGRLTRIVFDGWEGRIQGAMHLERRTWTVAGEHGGPGARRGFESIAILELRRPRPGARPEHPLHEHARPSTLDGPGSTPAGAAEPSTESSSR